MNSDDGAPQEPEAAAAPETGETTAQTTSAADGNQPVAIDTPGTVEAWPETLEEQQAAAHQTARLAADLSMEGEPAGHVHDLAQARTAPAQPGIEIEIVGESSAAEQDEDGPAASGSGGRHVHSYYAADFVLSHNESILSERRIIVEHEHDDPGKEHLPNLAIGGGAEPAGYVTPSYFGPTAERPVDRPARPNGAEDAGVEPFQRQDGESPGLLIPRQPELAPAAAHQERGGEQSENLPHRVRRPAPDPRGRPSQPTREQLEAGTIMVTKSRMPARLLTRHLLAYAERERKTALDVRDPIAIAYAAERYSVLSAVLSETGADEEIDLLKPMLTVSQAAKMLGYNAKELRRLLGQGKVSGRKVGSEWRIPLRAVL